MNITQCVYVLSQLGQENSLTSMLVSFLYRMCHTKDKRITNLVTLPNQNRTGEAFGTGSCKSIPAQLI